MTIKRIIVISMPASMGAIIVDGFDKEWKILYKTPSLILGILY
jgi:hypothetical protein